MEVSWEKYTELWDEVKEELRLIIGDKKIEYSIDFMKIKFESDDDLSLDEIMNIPVCVLIIGGVLKEDSQYYPHVLLHECYYEYEHQESTNL